MLWRRLPSDKTVHIQVGSIAYSVQQSGMLPFSPKLGVLPHQKGVNYLPCEVWLSLWPG